MTINFFKKVSNYLKNNKKQKNLLVGLFLFLLSSILSIIVFFWIVENYFFDKVYYQKSTKHGYWVPGKDLTLEIFGSRAKDMADLIAFARSYNPELDKKNLDNVLGEKDDSVYTVVVIGDSFTWGQGLKNEDRYPEKLEKDLNKLRNTRVISLAMSGDSFIDNFIKYKLAEAKYRDIDLFIFGIIENDLFFNRCRYNLSEGGLGSYSQEIYNNIFSKIASDCPSKFVYDPFELIVTDVEAQKNAMVNYYNSIDNLFSNDYGNFCVLEKTINYWPKSNSIYLSLDSGKIIDKYANILNKNNLFFISADQYVKNKYPDIKKEKLVVSKLDPHPSALANKIFAEILYNEITTNKKWKFYD